MRIPHHQLHHQLDLLLIPNRGHSEQVLDVDDPEATNLHVVLDDRIPGSIEAAWFAPHDVDNVIGYQPMSPHHQVQGDLAFANSTLAQHQDSHSEDVNPHPAQAGYRGERVFQEALNLLNEER